MNDIRYLLSIKELLDGPSAEQLIKQAYAKLDRERRRKLDAMKTGRKYAECLGAGLLLQMGLQEVRINDIDVHRESSVRYTVKEEGISWAHAEQNHVQHFTVSQIVSQIINPIEAEYTYGEKGKPYFKKNPTYFSLSHSGDYVFCVFSEQEVGADIQYQKQNFSERIVSRFFTEKEQEVWNGCSDEEARKHFFYKIWARKEAYGKLTGDGIVTGLLIDVLADKDLDVCWEDYEILEDYQISICKRTGKKE